VLRATVLGAAVIAGAWIAAVAFVNLTVDNAYLWQYWHPRLIVAALPPLVLVGAWALDQITTTTGRRLFLAIVIAQAVVQSLSMAGV
jgi:hypothetical protein